MSITIAITHSVFEYSVTPLRPSYVCICGLYLVYQTIWRDEIKVLIGWKSFTGSPCLLKRIWNQSWDILVPRGGWLTQTVWRHKWKVLIGWISRQFGAASALADYPAHPARQSGARNPGWWSSGQGIPQRRKIGDTESDLFDAKNVEGFLRVFFLFFFWSEVKMGVIAPYGPLSWGPRPILKKREVDFEASIEALALKLSMLRTDSNLDWDDLDRNIWVRTADFSTSQFVPLDSITVLEKNYN